MNPNNYISKYGIFSHIINIFINEELCGNEKIIIITSIYNMLNNKEIIKNISGTYFPLTWRVSDENDLFHYYTNGSSFIMSDDAIQKHTIMVMDDIKLILGTDKFYCMITKPISINICI